MILSSIESERAVLGAIIIEKKAYYSVAHILTSPEMFYFDEHKHIFAACSTLVNESSKPVDLVMLADKLRGKKIDPEYLVDLSQTVHRSINIESHARIIVERWMLRNCQETALKVIEMLKSDNVDCFDTVELMSTCVTRSLQGTNSRGPKSASELLEKFKSNFENSILNMGIVGVGTGLRELDALMGGFQRKKVYIFAARPAMGKTAFGLFMIYCFARLKKRCLVFSLEMPEDEVFARLVSMELMLTGQQVTRGIKEVTEEGLEMMTKEDIRYYNSLLDKSPVLNSEWIHIDDTPALDINDQKAKCNIHKNKYPDLEVILSDYIGLKKDRTCKGNHENEISSISQKGKQIAKDLDVVWIDLAQLNRGVEQRGGDKRPQLSDIRESGSIEQDADFVGFLYRPEYYKIEQDENGNDVKNKTEIIIAKHRGGAIGSVWLTSFMSTYRYYDNDYLQTIDINHRIVEKQYTFDDKSGEVFQLPEKNDVFKSINGARHFE